MQLARTRIPLFFAAMVAVLLGVTGLFAQGEWTHTGTGIRVKTVAVIDVNVYEIKHFMKQLPPARTKRAVIDMETGKKFSWTMLRDVDQDKIKTALKDAFAMNGYADGAKIGLFISAFKGDLKEKSHVNIVYDPDKKETTVSLDSGSSATVGGVDFMKAVWSIWFGKIDQPKLGDQLLSRLP